MDAGFHYNARVTLADGSTCKHGLFVNQRHQDQVLGFDTQTGTFHPTDVVGWHSAGPRQPFIQITTAANAGNGRHSFGCTPLQQILTPHGYRAAADLKVGDDVLAAVRYYLSPTHSQIVYGSMLGDGSLRRVSAFNTALRIGHGPKQDAYCWWKQGLFDGLIGSSGTNAKGGHSFDTIPMYELTDLIGHGYNEAGKTVSDDILARLEPLAAAIWYLDDGTFDKDRLNRCAIRCSSLSMERRTAAVHWFQQRSIDAVAGSDGMIRFGVQATRSFHALIAPYVHPSMEYKLMPEFRGCFVSLELAPQPALRSVPMPIIEYYAKPFTRGGLYFKLAVADADSYMVDGVIVQSRPRIGRALREQQPLYALR